VRRPAAALIAVWGTALAGQSGEPGLLSRDAYLMGTRAQLSIRGPDRGANLALLDRALAVLEDTDRELSTWRDDSAISGLNRAPVGVPWPASSRLCAMFATVYAWHRETAGAFDPAIGVLGEAWDVHGAGRVPRAGDLASARARSGLGLLRFSEQACTLTRLADVRLDTGAFGKGEALDRAEAVLAGHDWMIDLGGQVSAGVFAPSAPPWVVGLAHPGHRTRSTAQVRITGGSLSTSGGSERDLHARGVRIGHVLDPRTGRPAAFDGAVVAWHERGLVADILSTALYVMGPADGLRWAEAKGVSAAYLLTRAGKVEVRATSAFARLIAPE
jgi:thiamine biosynthesis lipoprotein